MFCFYECFVVGYVLVMYWFWIISFFCMEFSFCYYIWWLMFFYVLDRFYMVLVCLFSFFFNCIFLVVLILSFCLVLWECFIVLFLFVECCWGGLYCLRFCVGECCEEVVLWKCVMRECLVVMIIEEVWRGVRGFEELLYGRSCSWRRFLIWWIEMEMGLLRWKICCIFCSIYLRVILVWRR